MSTPSGTTRHHTTVDLVSTSFAHPGSCGEHVRSPHPQCQARLDPYHAAERFVLRHAVVVRCRCGAAWREVQPAEAAA